MTERRNDGSIPPGTYTQADFIKDKLIIAKLIHAKRINEARRLLNDIHIVTRSDTVHNQAIGMLFMLDLCHPTGRD